MDSNSSKGLLGIEYARERQTRKSSRYRLLRRTGEVLAVIEKYAHKPVEGIVDLGTADGRMLESIHKAYPSARCLGIEHSAELADFAKKEFPHLDIIQADAQSLDLQENSFDIAIAAAVIEHLPRPEAMIREAKRILSPGGIIVITSPDPFWERLAGYVGHLQREKHQNVMDLKELAAIVQKGGFSVLYQKKFMLSPVGMPLEEAIERVVRRLGMSFLMANQLLVARA